MADNSDLLAGASAHEQRADARPDDGALGALRRLLRLWALYARMDFVFMTADIRLTLSWYLSDAIINLASVTGMLLLAQRFAGIGSWTQPQMIFMLGYATTVSGLGNTLFGYNVLMISRRIGRGQLDHSLIQPQPLWMTLLTEGFTPCSGAPMLLPGLGLMIWALLHMQITLKPGWLLLLGLYLLSSLVILMSFAFIWGSLAFWAPRAAEEISSSAVDMLTQLKSFPLDGLAPLLLGSLLGVVPAGLLAWYPCRVLLGIDHIAGDVWLTPLAALLLAALASGIFYKGLQHYAHTGSQRYSGLGHRG